MIIFFIEQHFGSESFYLKVNPNDIILEFFKKHKLINFEKLKEDLNPGLSLDIFLKIYGPN